MNRTPKQQETLDRIRRLVAKREADDDKPRPLTEVVLDA